MSGEFSPSVKRLIWEREDGYCGLCGSHVRASMFGWSNQHRRARGAGGSKDPLTASVSNGVLMCGSATTDCHGYVEGHGTAALTLGFRVPQGIDPATVPIRIARQGWVYLDAHGGYLLAKDPHPEETEVVDMSAAALRWAS